MIFLYQISINVNVELWHSCNDIFDIILGTYQIKSINYYVYIIYLKIFII